MSVHIDTRKIIKEWIDYNDSENSVLSYLRKGNNSFEDLVVVINMTPVPKENYKVGVPRKGKLKEVFNSDLKKYYGSGKYKNKLNTTKAVPWNYRDFSVEINVPPLGMVAFKYSE